MLELKNLHLAFGGDRLFEGITAFVGDRERIGLIGANGAGKSTLFKIITGDQRADQGQLDWQRGRTLGILRQELEFPENMALIEYIKTAQGDINDIDDKIAAIEEALEKVNPDDWEKQTELSHELYVWQEKKRLFGADKLVIQAEKIATGLGYKPEEFQKPLEAFSGGWKMRAELGRLLLMQPDLLLLDEPTNHLDIYSILWLESWLSSYGGSVIFISHDAQFIENVSQRIWEIESKKLRDYTGSYETYLIHKADTLEKTLAAALNQDKKLKDWQRTADRFRAKKNKAKFAQTLLRRIDKEERIEVDNPEARQMSIRWPEFHPGGRETVKMSHIKHAYKPEHIVINDADVYIERKEKIGFVGKNGTGKSTMAKIMVGRLRPTAGEVQIGYKVDPYYFDQYASDKLDPKLTILETVEMAGSGLTTGELRSLLGSFMFSGEDVHKKTKVLSGGEKNRLALALMILSGSNFLVLDEPTNHLDMYSREVLKEALQDYPGTLVVVSHDRTFMEELTDRTYFFDYGRVTNYLGDINYVLEREEAESMRTLEMDEQKKESSNQSKSSDQQTAETQAETPKNEPDSKEKKQQQFAFRKQLKSVEQKIVRLEEKKAAYEADMAFPDFFEQADSQDVLKAYEETKSKIDVLHDEWEVLAEKIE